LGGPATIAGNKEVLCFVGTMPCALEDSRLEDISNAGHGRTSNNHRLIILTDMGNEPDDSQTMVHLLMYANEIDIEGLIAVTSRWLHPGRKPPKNRTHPELIVARVEAYGKVRRNLLKHAPGWPTKQQLLSRVAAGQPGYGMESVGNGKTSPGSRLIMKVLQKPDPRPVYFAINAGSNTLAQALWDLRKTCSDAELAATIKKIRVYDDAGQDNAGAWICREFPDIYYVRSRSQVFSLYCGYEVKETRVKGPYTWEPHTKDAQGQHKWAAEHIQNNHGPLGVLYPKRFGGNGGLEGGGTTSWIGLVNKGLYDPEQRTWGGWAGRFSERRYQVPARYQSELEKPYEPFYMYKQTCDEFTGEGITGFTEWVDDYRNAEYNPVWKWRRGYMNDFIGRMDWCVKDYHEANHNPVAGFRGDTSDSIVRLSAGPGQVLTLDASASADPDGDPLHFRWFFYPDPGTYEGTVCITKPTAAIARVTVPRDASGKQIHIVLQVNDENGVVSNSASREPSLYDYRRIVIDVEDSTR
jgi:hypothetical protein